MAGRPKIETEAERRAAEIRRAVAGDLRRLLDDAGLPAAVVAREAHLSHDMVSLILRARREPSLDTLARLSLALGAEVSVRLVPGAGVAIHDRYQSPMADRLVTNLHPRWTPFPEVAVRTPARGSIDLVLADSVAGSLIATEIESGLRRPEQTIRWSTEKASALAGTELYAAARAAAEADDHPPPTISRLLVVRSAPHTRAVVAELPALFAAAFPGPARDAVAALRDGADWPGPTLVWMRVERGRASLMVDAPRDLRRLGR